MAASVANVSASNMPVAAVELLRATRGRSKDGHRRVLVARRRRRVPLGDTARGSARNAGGVWSGGTLTGWEHVFWGQEDFSILADSIRSQPREPAGARRLDRYFIPGRAAAIYVQPCTFFAFSWRSEWSLSRRARHSLTTSSTSAPTRVPRAKASTPGVSTRRPASSPRSEWQARRKNPSFVAFHPSGKFLYAVNETGDGTLTAFGIDPKTGKLTRLNSAPSRGSDPCHLTVDRSGHTVLVANYSSGTVSGVRSARTASSANRRHSTSTRAPVPTRHGRNMRTRTRSTCRRSAIRRWWRTSAGRDVRLQVRSGGRNADAELSPPTTKSARPPALVTSRFIPMAQHAYAINELNSTITAYKWDGKAGSTDAHRIRVDTARRLQRREFDRGGGGAPEWEVRLWVESRPRQHRRVPRRPERPES